MDADVLSIGGLGLNFDDLSLTQQGDDALIAALDTDIAILTGIQASDLDSDNFSSSFESIDNFAFNI